jgi:predicted nucleotidyltransferase
VPIDIERFEVPADLKAPPTSERVIRFLIDYDDSAYTRGEIAEAIDAIPETVGTNLTRLKDRGLVRYRKPYWAVTEDLDHTIDTLRDRYDEAVVTEEASEKDHRGISSSAEPASSPHREAATVFFERVRDHLDTAIDALYLFGSVDRATPKADSDVDVLAVISDDVDYATVDDQLLDIAYDVELEYGVRVEVHSIRASEFTARNERGDPFTRTVFEEGEEGV